ncbi:hypothetical protein MNVI_07590 [Mycobacterium noviomagense]|nr:hypothetical protein [Mycobacterium noviomagense]BBY05441.1 hypothetical protein MNVI_07590 [Mycobacterium noviomagense]
MVLYPKEFAFADNKLAKAMGLPPRDDDWGCLFCLDDRGLRYTVVGSGDFLRTLLDLPPGHDVTKHPPSINLRSLGFDELPAEAFPLKRRGWPDQWTNKRYTSSWGE